MAEPLLKVEGLTKRYGGVVASDGISLDLCPGELHAIIGPNGAGKTTLIGQLAGEIAPDAGRIAFAGHDVTALPVWRRSGLGLARSFQITSLFLDFTALDNVAIAVQAHAGHSFRFWRNARRDEALRAPAREILARVGLTARADALVANLSHGEQRQLELAVALATAPQLLLLDEPMAGLGPTESARMVATLRELKRDLPILLVEHDMEAVFALADRISVLVYGRVIASGPPDAIRADPEVRRAYLGEPETQEPAIVVPLPPRSGGEGSGVGGPLASPATPLLEVDSIETFYGRSQVLFGLSFMVGAGEMVTLMGRNGMGKTTTVRSILGLTPAASGTIRFAGEEIRTLGSYRVGQRGIGLVPEGRQVFPNLTVRENLVATAANRRDAAAPWTLEAIYELFPGLAARRGAMASQLSGGEQQMLAIGRALMTNPRLLILDEATEGLAPLIREEIWRCLAGLKARGQSILVIDKNVEALTRIADRHYLIERGRVVWSGTSAELAAAPDVQHRYLGV